MEVLPYGSSAVLVQCQATETLGLYNAARAQLPQAIDISLGEQAVLITFDRGQRPPDDIRERLEATALIAHTHHSQRRLNIPVTYDGEDLEEVATLTRLTISELIEAHSSSDLTVAFTGFAPGFAYLTGLDSRLHLPRRSQPRPKVPAGSVAIAATYSAVYPRESPGGWWLIGRTDKTLFDLDSTPPTLLAPGAKIRFEPVTDR